MTMTLRLPIPAFAALALLSITGTSALAQTAPNRTQDSSRLGVREILNRAETESTRRTVGDILGGAVGVSRAQAQTAPAQTPGATDATSARAGSTQGPVAPAAPDASSRSPAAVAQSLPATPSTQQQGTAVDPSVIVRVPDSSAAPATAAAEVSPAGQADVSSAPAVVEKAVARPGVVAVRRVPAEWCPPSRW